jgi:hypothetical protein
MYNLPSGDISDISRWMSAKRSQGITVQPWELHQAFKEKFDVLNQNRIQAAKLGLDEQALAERTRMDTSNIEQTALNRAATLRQADLDRAAKLSALDTKYSGEQSAGKFKLAGAIAGGLGTYLALRRPY